MLYWLFYHYRPVALRPAVALTLLTLLLFFTFLLTVNTSVRRSATIVRTPAHSRWLKLFMLLTATAAVISWCASLLGNAAIQLPRGQPIYFPGSDVLIGPATIDLRIVLRYGGIMGMLILGVNVLLITQTAPASRLRLWVDQKRGLQREQALYGSSHFAMPKEFKRFRPDQPGGITLYGKFMGQKIGQRFLYLGDKFSLSDEDAARGIVAIGNPGSGKSSSVILPVIFDSLRLGQSLLVTDPQKELTPHILRYAAITGHRVIQHDPTDPTTARYNLAEGITTANRAQAVAHVLVKQDVSGRGNSSFWEDSARQLLAACLLRYDQVGDILLALGDMRRLTQQLTTRPDAVQQLAGGFINSVRTDGKIAGSVMATLNTMLVAWADEVVRQSTAAADFTTRDLVDPHQPTILILSCQGQYREVLGPYLGAVLTKLLYELDSLAEQQSDGLLPGRRTFRVILEEFPALGNLAAVVDFANLVRKRRIGFLLAAQTLAQLERTYGEAGTATLLAGMAFQIVFGGCDQRTAEYYSQMAGQTTETESAGNSAAPARLRARQLLTPDEIVRPPQGNCLIFGRYVEAEFATYVILLARLTRIYERTDVQELTMAVEPLQPQLLPRGSAKLPLLTASASDTPPTVRPFTRLTSGDDS